MIKVVPERLEVLSYGLGPTNKGDVWRTPSIGFAAGGRP
jgi:hypothetical protein